MTWNPIDFKDEPEETTPIDAQNLNYVQQGIVLAVDRSRLLDEAWKSGSLKGDKGDKGDKGETGARGEQGAQGIQGLQGANGDTGAQGIQGAKGDTGDDGRNFEVDGIVALLEDLPPANDHSNQIWLTNQYGHLHFSNGDEWLDWGQFTGLHGEQGEQGIQGIQGATGAKGEQGLQGVQGLQGIQGEKGDAGRDAVLDVDALTQEQLLALYRKLYPLADTHRWHYKTSIVTNKNSIFQIADTNLNLVFTNYGSGMMTYKVVPIDTAQPATYYIKRLANYDLTAWEGTATSGYTSQAIGASGFVLDSSAYFAGREDIKVGIYDPFNDFWYTVEIFGDGTANNILIDIEKRAVQGRVLIAPI